MQFAFEVSTDEEVKEEEEEEEEDDDDDDDLDKVLDEFADPETATKSLKVPTDEETQAFIAALDEAAGKPPSSAPVTSEPPRSESETELSPPLKRRKRDPRPGVLITEATTVTPTPIIPPTQDIPEHISQGTDSPIIEEYASEEEEEEFVVSDKATQASGSGSSSAQGPPQGPLGGDPRLEATLRLAQHLIAEDTVRPSQAGIHIGAEKGKQAARSTDQIICDLEDEVTSLKQKLVEKDILIGTLDVRVSDLEKEKDKQAQQISYIQANLGGLTAIVYDLKSKLSQKFGDEFGSAAASSSRPSKTAEAHPAPDVALEQYLSSGPARKKSISKKKKGSTLMQKSSDQNLPGDAPQAFLTDLGERKYVDKFGDRSGIKVWGFDERRNAWVVKRKSGRIEYYEKETDFMSWTKVDLSELLIAPFYNPSKARRARDFMTFLQRQAKTNFEYLNLATSFIKRAHKDVIDPNTGKRFRTVMWPATRKMKKVPMTRPIPDGSLNTMEFWVYDEQTSSVVIKLPKGQYRIVDPRDLLMFGKRDIQTLSGHQLKVNHEDYESATKEFTSMLAKILDDRLWAGALGAHEDVALVDL